MKCPICDTENVRQYWSESFGVVEDYYFCERCGYFHEMAYSPYHEGIELIYRPIEILPKFFRQVITLLIHFRKARKYKFSKSHF